MTLPEELLNGGDRSKAMMMCLVHDLAEAIVGDITPECGISSNEKHAKEEQAMREITGLLKGSPSGELIFNLYKEYEKGVTPEAVLVKDIDKIEFLLQADSYEMRYPGKNFDDFRNNTISRIKNRKLMHFLNIFDN
jgi:putative hydrolases of HD superfamily